jgi:type IV secretion system protein VirD4
VEPFLRRAGRAGREDRRPGKRPGEKRGRRPFLKLAALVSALLLCALAPAFAQASGTSFYDEYGSVIIVVGLIAAFLGFGYLLQVKGWRPKEKGFSFKPPEKPQDTYGSADWAEATPHMPDPMSTFMGVFFGKSSTPGAEKTPLEQHMGAPICSRPEKHCLIVAQTRTGKGTRICVPTLLRYVNSCIVIDPKGENAAVTARARTLHPFNQPVHIINPWGELAPTFASLGLTFATYNPLDILNRADPNVVGMAQALAAAICPIEKGDNHPFWTQSAASILTAILLWLTEEAGEVKTLGRVREIIGLPKKEFTDNFLGPMSASKAFGGAIRESAGPFIGMAMETYSGVMGNLAQFTFFLSDPRIKAATATSSFSISDLMRKPTTIYLVIPPDLIDTQRTWLRLMISAGMQTYRHPISSKPIRCMFLIDEFGSLGLIRDFQKTLAVMAGYGVDFTIVLQDIAQLRDVYGDGANTIINNCAYKWFCNVGDLQTAEYLSKVIGKTTVATTGSSTSMGHSAGGGTSGSSTTFGQTGRPLLMPDEIMNLGRDVAILLAPGEKPQYLRPVDYWDLVKAFTPLHQFYPDLYTNPPLTYDENPLPH